LNPDDDGPLVVYDGIEAKAYAKITPGSDWSSLAGLEASPPSIEIKLLDNTSGVTGTYFDTHPGSRY